MPKRHLQDHQQENLPKHHSQSTDLNLVLKTNQRSQINLGVINLHRDLANLLKWLYKEMIRQTRANQKSQILQDAMPHPSGSASTLKWLCKITTKQLTHQRHQLELHLNMLGNMHKWQCKVIMILSILRKSQLHLNVLENMLRWQCKVTMKVVFEHQVHCRKD